MKSEWLCTALLDVQQKIKIQVIFIDWIRAVPNTKIYE